jgi:hypothetical protein
MAPLLCWLIELTQLGSGEPGFALGASFDPLLQLASKKAAAGMTSAVTILRIMESPEGVSTQLQYNAGCCRFRGAIVAKKWGHSPFASKMGQASGATRLTMTRPRRFHPEGEWRNEFRERGEGRRCELGEQWSWGADPINQVRPLLLANGE